MKFKLKKDGLNYEEVIDIAPLVKKMAEKYEVPDVWNTRWKGSASINVYLNEDELSLVYEVAERVQEPIYKVNRKHFPLFSKNLVPLKSQGKDHE